MTHIDELLQLVVAQAKALGIPVSKNIHRQVTINGRAKSRFGCCKKYGSGYILEVSEGIAKGPEKSLLQTLAHEVLHTCPGCQNHSTGWKKYAEAMNKAYGYKIQRTSTPKELGLSEEFHKQKKKDVRYILVCEGCGLRIERTRKSRLITHTELYRCRCGSKLDMIR